MSYKWKPNANQRAAYAAAMHDAEAYCFIHSPHPIRTGDTVEWFDVNSAALLSGVVLRHSYGAERGQHTFSIQISTKGSLKLVKGRNLYPKLTRHQHVAGT